MPQNVKTSQSQPNTNKDKKSQMNGEIKQDKNYNLISILYHALQGADTYLRYVEDANRAEDHELAEFFQECCDEERDRAERAQELLAIRINHIKNTNEKRQERMERPPLSR